MRLLRTLVFLCGLSASRAQEIDRDVIDDPTCVIDESYRSELGWTWVHHLAYYGEESVCFNIQDLNEASSDAAEVCKTANEEFLCHRNDFGQTALHLAVRQDLQELIAVYTKRQICLNVGNNDGDSPLHYAAAHGRYEAAKLLVEAGAKVDIRNLKGELPRDDALKRQCDNIISLLDGRTS